MAPNKLCDAVTQSFSMTIDDLRELVDRCIPHRSIHPMYDPSIAWWSSHELGHRLVAAPIEIGLAYYGLEEGSPTAEAFGPGHEDYAYCCEHAAMRLSARLLRTIGANDAAGDERNHLRGSSPIAAAWLEIPGNRVKVNALIDRRCRILPYTRAALEKRLRGGHS